MEQEHPFVEAARVAMETFRDAHFDEHATVQHCCWGYYLPDGISAEHLEYIKKQNPHRIVEIWDVMRYRQTQGDPYVAANRPLLERYVQLCHFYVLAKDLFEAGFFA